MITRTTRIQLLAFLTLAVLATSYLGYKYVGLDRLVLGSGYEVAAEFEDSGGIFVNAEVTYRGSRWAGSATWSSSTTASASS